MSVIDAPAAIANAIAKVEDAGQPSCLLCRYFRTMAREDAVWALQCHKDKHYMSRVSVLLSDRRNGGRWKRHAEGCKDYEPLFDHVNKTAL